MIQNAQEEEAKKPALRLYAFIEKTEQNSLQKIETHLSLHEILAIRRQMPSFDSILWIAHGVFLHARKRWKIRNLEILFCAVSFGVFDAQFRSMN